MAVRTRATVHDLYTVPEDGKAELVNGELVIMGATGGFPGYAAGEIYASLREYGRRTRRGYAFPDNVGFLVKLPHRQSFSPDAAFFVGPWRGLEFLEGAPLFAAEVRSENDYGAAPEREMAAKRADYFAAGTLVVWDVDLMGPDTVRVYRADAPLTPTVYRRGEMAEAEPGLPGWRFNVDDLFPGYEVIPPIEES